MKIKKSLKGDYQKGQKIEISTPTQSAACGVTFTKGKYAIYGNEHNKQISTRTCSHTAKLESSEIKNYEPKKTRNMRKRISE